MKNHIESLKHSAEELIKLAEALYEWVDAVPDELADQLAAMPGHDRDWGESAIDEAKKNLKELEESIKVKEHISDPVKFFKCKVCGVVEFEEYENCICGAVSKGWSALYLQQKYETELTFKRINFRRNERWVDPATGELVQPCELPILRD